MKLSAIYCTALLICGTCFAQISANDVTAMLEEDEGGTRAVEMVRKLPPDQQGEVLDAVVRKVREKIPLPDPSRGSTYISHAAGFLAEVGTDETRIACFGKLSEFGLEERSAAFALASCHGPAGVAIINERAKQRLPDLERMLAGVERAFAGQSDDKEKRKSNDVFISFMNLVEILDGSKNVAGPIAAKRLRDEFAKRCDTKNKKIVLAAFDDELTKAASRRSAATEASRKSAGGNSRSDRNSASAGEEPRSKATAQDGQTGSSPWLVWGGLVIVAAMGLLWFVLKRRT